MFNSHPVISRLVTEDIKELYTTSNMQQNTILVTQFQKNSTKSILKMQACHVDGQTVTEIQTTNTVQTSEC
jgi:hypothetical protein